MVDQLEELRGKVARVTQTLDEMAAGRGGHAGVALLRTIPGIGPRTAEAFMAYVDDPHRFRSGTIGAYFGLVPREDSTGEHRRLGHITREGPPTVRKLLTESCWRGISQSPRIKEVFERHLKSDRGRRKLALVATSHWLCRVMLAMLKSGEAFKEAAAPSASAAEEAGGAKK
jgi:transposase